MAWLAGWMNQHLWHAEGGFRTPLEYRLFFLFQTRLVKMNADLYKSNCGYGSAPWYIWCDRRASP